MDSSLVVQGFRSSKWKVTSGDKVLTSVRASEPRPCESITKYVHHMLLLAHVSTWCRTDRGCLGGSRLPLDFTNIERSPAGCGALWLCPDCEDALVSSSSVVAWLFAPCTPVACYCT